MRALQSRFSQGDLRAAFEMIHAGGYQAAEAMVLKAAPEPTLCPVCGGPLHWFVQDHYREACEWKQETKCPGCEEARVRSKFLDGIDTILMDRGVPRRYRRATIEDFSKAIQEATQGMGSLCLIGGVGTGKTHLLAAKLRQTIVDAHMTVNSRYEDDRIPRAVGFAPPYPHQFPLFRPVNGLLLEIRQTFNRQAEETEGGIIDECANAPVLVLDDLGVERPSEWALATIFEIIDRRYTEERPLWCSSNLNLEELAQRLGDRITSRIAGMCEVYEMAGEDRRPTEPKITGPTSAYVKRDNRPQTPVWM